jgi:hypothetical protein
MRPSRARGAIGAVAKRPRGAGVAGSGLGAPTQGRSSIPGPGTNSRPGPGTTGAARRGAKTEG